MTYCRTRISQLSLTAVIFVPTMARAEQRPLSVTLEAGAAGFSRNDVRIHVNALVA